MVVTKDTKEDIMARKETKETIKMKEEFMELRNSGKTINEIAKICGVTNQCIYRHLQEIADENHVSRDELLSRDCNQHSKKNELQQEKEILSTENLKKYFLGMLENVDGIILAIDDALKMEELK